MITQKQNKISEKDLEILKLLAHPARFKITLELLHNQKLNVTQLTSLVDLPQSTISQHLSRMKGKILGFDRKGLEVYYYINNETARKVVLTLLDK
ncbi:metalloregulator ArsR/SmtB family transcription factor [Bacillus cytotoxicus]|uniref:ArsR/SmtB family transcription factor n=1 Tax=Bacillus cereus group TaxID=86661 RepID=UPI000B96A8FD|nr:MULTISPECIES: metalloregulator ArsR/SmtB family transcription factor [Bacillus cereus group]AWC31009.1 transcriptional regulator [Bacillus cytotoxicus]AWC35043.1 transcriptional regulator [Bacillus cytotoxicus]AWC39082.1 transcriptional regulator [Bacillus cytotoxicus]AWC43101.1 transcriptional regulator [Bacillus cytotoxicus]AWC46986.1 transcriptional regulator [Bacillus cytotoxicus]